MPRGMCELTMNDRSILVDQAEFDFITHSFVEKRKNGSKVITRTPAGLILEYSTYLKFYYTVSCRTMAHRETRVGLEKQMQRVLDNTM